MSGEMEGSQDSPNDTPPLYILGKPPVCAQSSSSSWPPYWRTFPWALPRPQKISTSLHGRMGWGNCTLCTSSPSCPAGERRRRDIVPFSVLASSLHLYPQWTFRGRLLLPAHCPLWKVPSWVSPSSSLLGTIHPQWSALLTQDKTLGFLGQEIPSET